MQTEAIKQAHSDPHRDVLTGRRLYRQKVIFAARLAAIGVGYALLVTPTMLVPMINESAASPWLDVSGQAIWHSIDLARLLEPWGLGNPGYLAFAVGAAGLWFATRKRGFEREMAAFWGIAVLIFYFLSLGPTLQFADRDTGIALPYSLFEDLPVFSSGRNPGRFSLVALLGLGILVAFGLRELFYMVKRRLGATKAVGRSRWVNALPVVMTVLFVTVTLGGFVGAAGSATLDPISWPRFYQQIAADKADYAILELPPFTDLGMGEQYYQAFQILHDKPRFGGRWARDHKLTNPDNLVKHSSLFRRLFFMQYGGDQLKGVYPDKDFLQRTDYRTQGLQILNYYKVKYIVLYKDALKQPLMANYHSVLDEIFGPGAAPYYEDDQMQVYRVNDAPSPTHPLTLDTGEGWFPAQTNPNNQVYRWADSEDEQPSEIDSMNLTQHPVRATLTFTAYTWQQPRTLHVAVNGKQIAAIALKPEEGERQFQVAVTMSPGNNILTFFSPEPPQPTGQPHDSRLLSFGMYGVSLAAQP